MYLSFTMQFSTQSLMKKTCSCTFYLASREITDYTIATTIIQKQLQPHNPISAKKKTLIECALVLKTAFQRILKKT